MIDRTNIFMEAALEEARRAHARGEVPVGCVVVDSESGHILTEAGNRVEVLNDPMAHAELLAIREACQVKGEPRLPLCDVYVTLEPCAMCATAMAFARVRRLYFGAYDPKGGGVDHGPKIFTQSTIHHTPEVMGGLNEQECARLLKDFFQDKR